MLKSFADLQTDDWIMVLLLLPFTASTILTVSVGAGDLNSERQRINRYVLEELQIILVWSVKACLLVLYWRIL